MSCPFFSTRIVTAIPCDQPQFTINVPVAPAGANTVTLANGAIINLDELGEIIARTCPAFVCQPSVVVRSTTQPTQVVQAAPVGTGRDVQQFARD